VTKQFYEGFKHEHSKFLAEIKSSKMTEKADLEWYASVMLNRLMFVYFIQKKGFLDGNADYLRERLGKVQQRVGDDKFLSFYRHFLLRLFHNYLNKPTAQRFGSSQFDDLIGNVPYLNGGIFDEHELEKRFDDIQIADAAFTAVFDFFDQYRWHLDERANRDDREINPDVLGYIFEKYINQKQMGAYYTKEDITGYIAKSTIIPFLFDKAAAGSAISFAQGSTTWRLLTDNPDRYIYAAVRNEGRLPTETSREDKARRTRYADLRARLVAGEVTTINDLITHNLDILQFADDAISGCDSADLLRAFYKAIAGDSQQPGISVLDPTCGSGAFLFAALNILVRLYEACLIRMEGFIAEAERNDPVKAVGRYPDFRAVLKQRDQHANPRYFVLKSIIIGNLFGVDIMEEAVEIAKLRLFLKLAAQVEYAPAAPNMGLEPLPDVDFNIKAGNTLVGYVSLDEVRRAMTEEAKGQQTQRRMLEPEQQAELERIEEQARLADVAYRQFRRQQTELGGNVTAEDKANLRGRLARLDKDLDRLLVKQYGQEADFDNWRTRHQPFHWLTQFHGIMSAGGFDVIIGNPPYRRFSKYEVDESCGVGTPFWLLFKDYSTRDTGDLYALASERSLVLSHTTSRWSFIVPLSLTFSEDFESLREILQTSRRSIWYSNFDNIPDRAFTGAKESDNTSKNNQQRVTILVAGAANSLIRRAFSTPTLRWRSPERERMIVDFPYAEVTEATDRDGWPKLAGEPMSLALFKAVQSWPSLESLLVKKSSYQLIVPKTASYYVAAYKDAKERSEQMSLFFKDEDARDLACVIINGNFFFWWNRLYGDSFHITRGLVASCPVPASPKVGYKDLAQDIYAAQTECSVYKAYRGELVPNVNYNKRMDVLYGCDRWVWSHLPSDVPFDWMALLRYKSSSWFSFEIAKAASWPTGYSDLGAVQTLGKDADEGDEG